MRHVIPILLVLAISVPALAGPPLNGTYKSTDLGGGMLTGRYSEFWLGGAAMSVGNTVNEQSWDGSTTSFSSQWWWFCPHQSSPALLLVDTVDPNGNGQKVWRLDYVGGMCVLGNNGPWANGDPSYTANFDLWTAIVTQTWSGGVVVGEVRTVNAQATFVGYNQSCMSLVLSNAEKFGDTTMGPKPPDFPEFWTWVGCTNVGHGGPGEWGDVSGITFTITGCDVVPTRETTWGGLKAMYRD